MLTVVTWLWKGWRPVYDASHVIAVRNMLAEHLRIPHRVVCVTNEHVPGIECWPSWSAPVGGSDILGQPDCFQRLKLFAMEGEWLSIDLDCVILSDITALIERVRGQDFATMEGGTVCDYNGSMWYVNGNRRADVWSDLSPALVRLAKAKRSPQGQRPTGSDQVIMAYKLPGAPMWGVADGCYHYTHVKRADMVNPTIVFFAGRTKPWDAPEFKDEYRRYLEPC